MTTLQEYIEQKSERIRDSWEVVKITWFNWAVRTRESLSTIKHLTLGGLIALGSREVYHYYQGESNLTSSLAINHNNSSWLDNIYLNIPFNEPEYNNLTNLLNLPQSYQAQKVNDILFSGDDSQDWETELTRLKITDLAIQIPNKKNELAKLITETKNKLNKAENYLLELLLAENLNPEKLTELQTALSDHQTEIELILTKQQDLKDLERRLEKLQVTQLEAKIGVPPKS